MKDKIKELLHSDGFRSRSKAFYAQLSAHLSEKKISELLPKDKLEDLVGRADINELNLELINQYQRQILDIITKYIVDNEVTLGENLTDDSEQAIVSLLEEPLVLPRETVRQLVSQDAIQQLFVSIIHDSIMQFNKKVNPLAGAMAAFGMESQIKNFIAPFMGQVLDSSADFIVSNQNQQLFTKMAVSVFHIAKKEKPSPYLNSISQVQKEKLDKLSLSIAQDGKVQEFNRKITLHVISEFYATIADKKLGDLWSIEPEKFAEKYADLSLDLLLPIIQSDVVLDYLLNEVKEILN